MNRTGLVFALLAGLSFAAMADMNTNGAATPPAASTATAPTPPAAASASGVSVEKIAVGTGVESYEIQGEASEFPTGTEKVYCLSRIIAPNAPTTVKHVWSKDGVEMSTVSLNIKFSPFTTYSYHFMEPGAWKVDVRDESGAVISSVSFTVK